MESITSAQPPPCMPNHPALDIADLQGMDFPMSYVCKPRRGMKRGDDSKETYKLPHRLIEKKRRDRINECIAQLKDLLPEHLKLTTLGHLEKAVVLELTLKHVKALSAVLEQQQQKIIALQNGLHIGDHGRDSSESSEEMFRSGFHLCASEVLQYVTRQEPGRDVTPSRVIGHIHKLAAEVLRRRASPREEEEEEEEEEKEEQEEEQEEVRGPFEEPDKPAGLPARALEGHAQNCVPVIQRTCPHGAGELSGSGSDTDTDSGYGGEQEKRDPKAFPGKAGELKHSLADIKQETNGPPAKRLRSDSSGDEALGGGPGGYVSFSHNQPPFCLPFYLIPPAAAAYLPMLEKCWYAGGMPIVYPGMSASAAPESLPSSLVMSPRAGSPVPHQTSMDSPALLQALKQVPPLNLDGTE